MFGPADFEASNYDDPSGSQDNRPDSSHQKDAHQKDPHQKDSRDNAPHHDTSADPINLSEESIGASPSSLSPATSAVRMEAPPAEFSDRGAVEQEIRDFKIKQNILAEKFRALGKGEGQTPEADNALLNEIRELDRPEEAYARHQEMRERVRELLELRKDGFSALVAGEREEGLALLEKSLAGAKYFFGEGSPEVKNAQRAMENFGETSERLGRARALAEEITDIDPFSPEGRQRILEINLELDQIREAQEQPERETALMDVALKREINNRHMDASDLFFEGKVQTGTELMEEAIDISAQRFGLEDKNTIHLMESLQELQDVAAISEGVARIVERLTDTSELPAEQQRVHLEHLIDLYTRGGAVEDVRRCEEALEQLALSEGSESEGSEEDYYDDDDYGDDEWDDSDYDDDY